MTASAASVGSGEGNCALISVDCSHGDEICLYRSFRIRSCEKPCFWKKGMALRSAQAIAATGTVPVASPLKSARSRREPTPHS
eukprot:5427077-Pleurochrysis_carterae.AAC.1